MVRGRGGRRIKHRKEVGKILDRSLEPLTAKQISDKLNDAEGSRRKLTTVRLNAISISQMLRGAKGVSSRNELRTECDSNRRKVFEMENYDEYTVWVESKRRVVRESRL
jgi:hypothetical protein